MNKSISIILSVVAVIIIISGWYLFSTPRATAPVSTITPIEQSTTNTAQAPVASSTEVPVVATVKYTANGFSPDPITIKQGGTVTFESVDGSPMWVASNAHPSHLQYDGTSRAQHCPNAAGAAFDQCASGKSYSFKFLKVGDWNYHNHVNADDGGTIMVVQ